jgi:secreted trypsin-like serine protease
MIRAIPGRLAGRIAAAIAGAAVVLLAGLSMTPAGAVIGGRVVRAGRYPGLAQVVVNDLVGGQGTLCGGALIAPRVVVTAGHCFLNVPIRRLRPVSVVFGRQRAYPRSNPPTGIHVAVGQVAHAPIDPRLHQPFPDDVELLHLRRRAPVPPLALASAAGARPGTPVSVIGWGITSDHQSELTPKRLHGLTMHIRSNPLCHRVAGTEYDAPTQICLTARAGAGPQGTCYGDSGTPLLSADGRAVLGVVSTSNDFCGRGASIFARLSSGPLRRWVTRQTRAWGRPATASPAKFRVTFRGGSR